MVWTFPANSGGVDPGRFTTLPSIRLRLQFEPIVEKAQQPRTSQYAFNMIVLHNWKLIQILTAHDLQRCLERCAWLYCANLADWPHDIEHCHERPPRTIDSFYLVRGNQTDQSVVVHYHEATVARPEETIFDEMLQIQIPTYRGTIRRHDLGRRRTLKYACYPGFQDALAGSLQ